MVTSTILVTAGGLFDSLRRLIDPRDQCRASRRRVRPANHRRRMRFVLIAIVAVFGFLVSRLAELQVVNRDNYLEFGDSQRFRTLTLAADRGSILDRNGVELVMSRPMQSIVADPQLIDDPAAVAEQLAPFVRLDVADVEKKLRSPGRFAYVARKVTPEVAAAVGELGLPGIAFVDESERFLPSGALAQSVLGVVDIDNVGLTGLEKAYQDQLAGNPGVLTLEASPLGRTIAVGDQRLEPAVRGSDVILTIDRAIQYEVEQILAEQVEATGSKGAIAIVSLPDTGEILAMANMVRDEETDQIVPGSNNAAMTTVYEPGSVMKMVTVSAAMEEGLVDPDTLIDVPPVLRVGDTDFQDAEPHGALVWNVTQVFAHSSNIGTIKIAQQLGKDRLYGALRAFGFGQLTAVNFPNQVAGVVPEPEDWWSTSIGTIPIGQGVSVTPLQMLSAYNVIANGGVYVPPRLVQETIDPNGQIQPNDPSGQRRVLSEATVNEMNLMLRDVVQEGTGQLAAIDGYTPAGKTGTSRKPQPTGGYVDEFGRTHYQSTFVGFVPAEQPAVSVIVIMDDPKGSLYTGGAVAAPAFSRISSFVLRYLGIPPPLTDGADQSQPMTSSTSTPDSSVNEGSSSSSTSTPSTVPYGPGVTVGPDGRIRVVRAGEATQMTLVPQSEPDGVSSREP